MHNSLYLSGDLQNDTAQQSHDDTEPGHLRPGEDPSVDETITLSEDVVEHVLSPTGISELTQDEHSISLASRLASFLQGWLQGRDEQMNDISTTTRRLVESSYADLEDRKSLRTELESLRTELRTSHCELAGVCEEYHHEQHSHIQKLKLELFKVIDNVVADMQIYGDEKTDLARLFKRLETQINTILLTLERTDDEHEQLKDEVEYETGARIKDLERRIKNIENKTVSESTSRAKPSDKFQALRGSFESSTAMKLRSHAISFCDQERISPSPPPPPPLNGRRRVGAGLELELDVSADKCSVYDSDSDLQIPSLNFENPSTTPSSVFGDIGSKDRASFDVEEGSQASNSSNENVREGREEKEDLMPAPEVTWDCVGNAQAARTTGPNLGESSCGETVSAWQSSNDLASFILAPFQELRPPNDAQPGYNHLPPEVPVFNLAEHARPTGSQPVHPETRLEWQNLAYSVFRRWRVLILVCAIAFHFAICGWKHDEVIQQDYENILDDFEYM